MSEFAQDITGAGLSLSEYPELSQAADDYIAAAQTYVQGPYCTPQKFDGSTAAMLCANEFLLMKWSLGTLATVLAAQAGMPAA